MKIKLDENGNAVLKDGRPVYVMDDGEEVAIDAPALHTKVSELNGEAKKHRLNAKDANEKLAAFDGIDPDEAKKAMKVVSGLDAKTLIDAGEANKIKDEMAKGYEEKLTAANATIESKDAQIVSLLVNEKILASPVLEKTIYKDAKILAVDAFSKHFKVEERDGSLVVVGQIGDGIPVMSKENPANFAGFDEALESIINSLPHKDGIWKAGPGGGSGSSGNTGGDAEVNPWKPDTFNLTMQGQIMKSDPAKAASLKKAAGVK